MFYKIIFVPVTVALLCEPIQGQNQDASVMHLYSNLSEKNVTVTNYTMFIVTSGSPTDSVTIINSKPKYVELKVNKVYAIYYKKEGAANKIIVVNTTLPKNMPERGNLYKVLIDVEVNRGYSKQKTDFDDFPCAIITYNQKAENFDYVKSYHKQAHE